MGVLSHSELFPDEAFPENPDDTSELLEVPSYWKDHYELVKKLHRARIELLGEDRYLSLAEQHQLASDIQNGLEAELLATTLGESYEGEHDAVIAKGKHARQTLVVVNLPFAAYYARASVGKMPPETTTGIQLPSLRGDIKSYVGTYTNIRKLASPHASIDDRTQVAMEAMWKAADKYKPVSQATFTSYAAWHIQNALAEYMVNEARGWHVESWTINKYKAATDTQAMYGKLPEIHHKRPDGGVREASHPSVMLAGRQAVSLEDAGVWQATEEDDYYNGEEQTELNLADITPHNAPEDNDVFEAVSETALGTVLDYLLECLNEREADILRLRFGFDGAPPMTLNEIGQIYGRSHERIRQIERKALDRLRYPGYSRILVGFLATSAVVEPPTALPTLADGTAHIKTQPIPAQKTTAAIIDIDLPAARPENLEDWQVFEEEEWEIDLRDIRR